MQNRLKRSTIEVNVGCSDSRHIRSFVATRRVIDHDEHATAALVLGYQSLSKLVQRSAKAVSIPVIWIAVVKRPEVPGCRGGIDLFEKPRGHLQINSERHTTSEDAVLSFVHRLATCEVDVKCWCESTHFSSASVE